MSATPVLLERLDLAKYPFLPETQEYIRTLGLAVEDLCSSAGAAVLRRARERIEAAIERRVDTRLDDDVDVEILSFPAAVLLLRLAGDKLLARRFAVAEGKRVSRFLAQEPQEKLVYVVTKGFGWKLRKFNGHVGNLSYDFLVSFGDFVSNVPEYRGLWKLVNRPLMRGWVPVSAYELARMAEEATKRYIEGKCLEPPPEGVPSSIESIINEIRSEWSKRMERLGIPKVSKVERPEDAYPPCIRAILEDALAGKNIPHSARFALASFLLQIGKSVDEVIDVFRAAPDFREDIARYQVEHIAGLRGSRTRYTPFKCDNMRSLGLCKWRCKGVKHPLQFYRLALRRGKVEYEEIT